MSVATPEVAAPERVRRPAAPGPALRSPAAAPARRAPARSSGKKPRHHVGFAIFAGLVLTAMIIGIVTLNALLAQAAFRMDSLETRISALSNERLVLEMEEARVAAPGNIATWARHDGMQLPERGQVHALRLGNSHGADAADGDRTPRVDR